MHPVDGGYWRRRKRLRLWATRENIIASHGLHAPLRWSAALLLAGTATAGIAQDGEPPQSDGAPTANVADGTAQGRGTVYEPAYFAQFAPRNALDMVTRIPGFVITEQRGSARGLGQASQNVLINGERLSSKSDGVRDQLQRIPFGDVVRIEIVDGTVLDIPGLTGQVANVIVARSGSSGQFRYTAGFRAYNAQPQLYGGEISLTGKSGALDYTVALSNGNQRFGADGDIVITDGRGNLIETQATKFSGGFDNPQLSTRFAYKFSDSVLANLNLKYGEDFFFEETPETATSLLRPRRDRLADARERGPEYEIGGDIEFPLGPGRMKLIGLERYERDEFESRVIDSFDDGSDARGNRFTQTNRIGERIGRFEYGWRMLSADWQLAGEAAFNRLDRASGLFRLVPGGNFVAIPFPAGTGGVTEDRYEAILSISKQVTRTIAVQATAGGEYSRIEQTGSAANSRSFQRPKGSLSLAWTPGGNFDASVKVTRKVGQLSFGDFLASVALDDDNENAGNNALRPVQSWDFDIEANRRFGPWGSLKLEYSYRQFEDFIDFFPLDNGGEARGNIGDARSSRITATGTLKLDPIGAKGVRFDVAAATASLSVTDPFTGLKRPFSNNTIDYIEANFRHDIAGSDWAYGAGLFSNDNAPYSRRFEIGRQGEGPTFVDVFVENKDVYGLTLNASVANIFGATQNFERTVFAAPRPTDDILFRETSRRRIGPIFRLTVSGNF